MPVSLLRLPCCAALVALLVGPGCTGKESGKVVPPAAAAPVTAPAPAAALAPPAQSAPVDEGDGGDFKDAVGAGVKSGAARWKDTSVYVDGKPVGVLSFGELPITLKPVWKIEEASAPKRPGSNDPGFKIVKQRFYRFTDYLQAVGVDLAAVKELHVYGPKASEAIVVSGTELRRRGKDFLFHFGGEVWGKTIPVVPDEFGNGRTPDKVTAVMVYIEKKPPTLVWNQGMHLDGQLVSGVPYYGEPMRGGVRIYLDDRLATVVKRRLLDDSKYGVLGEDGKVRWKLFAFLEAQGIDTSGISEAWIVRNERRREKLTRAQLVNATFESSAQARGQILVGDEHLAANALAFHSRPVRREQMPQILPDEDDAVAVVPAR